MEMMVGVVMQSAEFSRRKATIMTVAFHSVLAVEPGGHMRDE